MSTYQCSVCFYICDLNLEVIEKFEANNYRLPHWKKTVPFAHRNFRKFGRMVSAHEIGRAYRKAVFLARSSDIKSRQGTLWSLYQNGILTTSFSLKYSSKCTLSSLNCRGLARLASARRPNRNRSVILFLQIYPCNSIYYYLARCNKFIPDLLP